MKERLGQKIEDIYREITKTEFPTGRYYLVAEIGGEIDGVSVSMPPLKYCFMDH